MNTLQDLLRWTSDHLGEYDHAWALVGGWAVSIRTEPRFTRDVDVAVAVETDHEAEALVSALTAGPFVIDSVVEQDAVSRLATVRLRPKATGDSGMLLDILFASSGIEREVCASAEWLECLPGVRVPVARCTHLLALKILARDDQLRPQDAGDIRALIREMSTEEMNEAKILLGLISERGFDRGRNLQKELERARREFGLPNE